jgi:hypothetical protein
MEKNKGCCKDEDMWIKYKGKVFTTWSGNTKDVDKSMIKSIANKKENIFGIK